MEWMKNKIGPKEQHQLLCFLHEIYNWSKKLKNVDMIALLRVNIQVPGQQQEAYAAVYVFRNSVYNYGVIPYLLSKREGRFPPTSKVGE
ncbi:hypothetical protein [Listeria fleischmannii]|uniref:Uncharacterized protein n=1 Tax=Listeria fleischmannii FSL S10-1203 TaxID=1265822 RepID=W7DHN9_9LIST|nr:hypothetical protein [Listeria fleischmannii]EUJ47036.1 hypothetical protein MCOL2_18584 [Listeria fleischmannii FSL S10-1203]